LTVRERAHDTRAPPDLAQDALERIVDPKVSSTALPSTRRRDSGVGHDPVGELYTRDDLGELVDKV